MWYLAVLDVAVGFGEERLDVGAVANVNGGVVSDIVGMRPSWNYGSVWKAW